MGSTYYNLCLFPTKYIVSFVGRGMELRSPAFVSNVTLYGGANYFCGEEIAETDRNFSSGFHIFYAGGYGGATGNSSRNQKSIF